MAAVYYLPQDLSQKDMAALYQASNAYVSPYRAEDSIFRSWDSRITGRKSGP